MKFTANGPPATVVFMTFRIIGRQEVRGRGRGFGNLLNKYLFGFRARVAWIVASSPAAFLLVGQ